MSAPGRYAVLSCGVPAPGLSKGDRLIVVDMQDGEVWFPVKGVTLMDAMAAGKGKWLGDLGELGPLGPDLDELVALAPMSWLSGLMGYRDEQAMRWIAERATAAAIRGAGVVVN
jgi:hypothetical protein